MRRRLKMRTKSLLCGCIVLLLMVVSMATPCFADTVIHGCVSRLFGVLRIVNSPGQCFNGESPISWNQAGPQGQTGPQGPKGDTGPAGPAGPAGLTAVYGWVRDDGVATLGDGFTSKYENGVYYISFNEDFLGDPDCVISLLASPDAFCSIIGIGPSILDVTCASPTIVNNNVLSYISPFQTSFAFLCVK
jgi:hypothetical protein